MALALSIVLGLMAAVGGGAAPPSDAAPHAVAPPPIHRHFIPIGPRRRAETVAYARRHYGLATWRIARPRVIVEHLTENASIAATYDTFAPDVPDVELHELPGLCSQFAIGSDGEIVQFTPIDFMCRHTVGLNWTAIGIEHVGFREQDVPGAPRSCVPPCGSRAGCAAVTGSRCAT